MTLKDATTHSLLMFVAASCVVLIVRALPQSQQMPRATASSDVDGRASAQTAIDGPALTLQDGVKVYYLHGNTRCPTCRTIEAYAQEAVQTGFADELKSRKIAWEVVNYESPGNERYATDYQVVAPNVVLAEFKDGKQVRWKGLPEVWEHVADKPTFVAFVQNSLRDFLREPAAKVSSSVQNPERSPSGSDESPLPLPQ